MLHISLLKPTGHANAKQVSHGGLRDDRPPHGRGGRAYMDPSGLQDIR